MAVLCRVVDHTGLLVRRDGLRGKLPGRTYLRKVHQGLIRLRVPLLVVLLAHNSNLLFLKIL